MKQVVLISCGKRKAETARAARDLYVGPFYSASLAYAEYLRPDVILILSAKHHVLPLGQVVEPYDLTLTGMRVNDVRSWAAQTLRELGEWTDLEHDRFTILAGDRYRRFLLPALGQYEIPFQGLGMLKQIQSMRRRVKGHDPLR